MIKIIVRGLLAAFALATSSVAMAEEKPVRSVLERVQLVPLSPGSAWHVSESEAEDLAAQGCAAGPAGAIDEQLGDTESPCSTSANREKRDYLKAGGFLYEIVRMGSAFVYTTTKMGTGRNPNFQCTFMVISDGRVTENSCVNTPNGKMMFDAIAGAALAQAVPAVLGPIAANVTAPKAGDTNIKVVGNSASDSGSLSGSQSGSSSQSSGSPVTVNNSNYNANANANANNNQNLAGAQSSSNLGVGSGGFDPNCPTNTCH